MSFNKSSSFIFPLLKLNTQVCLANGMTNCYIGDMKESDTWGEYIYLAFDKDKVNNEFIANTLLRHSDYISSYFTDTVLIVKYSIPEEYKESVVGKFIEGKYSEIDRKYVSENFQEFIRANFGVKSSYKYLVLTKSDNLRNYWEDRLGVTLPENAEVWSRAEKEDEMLHYTYPEEVAII
jgi:hypothetical protein